MRAVRQSLSIQQLKQEREDECDYAEDDRVYGLDTNIETRGEKWPIETDLGGARGHQPAKIARLVRDDHRFELESCHGCRQEEDRRTDQIDLEGAQKRLASALEILTSQETRNQQSTQCAQRLELGVETRDLVEHLSEEVPSGQVLRMDPLLAASAAIFIDEFC